MICGPVLLAAALMVVDFQQTQNITSQYPRYRETNPLLGEHPSAVGVTAHFALTGTGLALLSGKATCGQQRALWGAVVAVEGFCVANNVYLSRTGRGFMD